MSYVDFECYLVVGQKLRPSGHTDGRPSVEVFKTKPKLAPHQIALTISLRLPLSLFAKPSLHARIEVPPAAAPGMITPEIQSNIAKLVQEHAGIVLHVSAVPPPEVS